MCGFPWVGRVLLGLPKDPLCLQDTWFPAVGLCAPVSLHLAISLLQHYSFKESGHLKSSKGESIYGPSWCFNFYLFVALGLHCFVQTFSSCSEWGLRRCSGCAPASVVAAWCAEPLQCTGLVAPGHVESSRTRDRTLIPALAGGFLTTRPPGKF